MCHFNGVRFWRDQFFLQTNPPVIATLMYEKDTFTNSLVPGELTAGGIQWHTTFMNIRKSTKATGNCNCDTGQQTASSPKLLAPVKCSILHWSRNSSFPSVIKPGQQADDFCQFQKITHTYNQYDHCRIN